MKDLEDVCTYVDVGDGYRVALPHRETVARVLDAANTAQEHGVPLRGVFIDLPLLLGVGEEHTDSEGTSGWRVRHGTLRLDFIDAMHPQSARPEDAEDIVMAIAEGRKRLPELFAAPGATVELDDGPDDGS